MQLSTRHWLIIVILLCSSPHGFADNDTAPEPDKTNSLTLSEQIQTLSGITTQPIQAVNFQTELIAYGKALPLQNLLASRLRFQNALTELATVRSRAEFVDKTLARQKALYEQGISAQRLVQEQQDQANFQHAQLATVNQQQQALKDELVMQWGNTISTWLLNPHHALLDALISGQKTLLLLTLPNDKSLPASKLNVLVSTSADKNHAQTAELISVAPTTDTNSIGFSYYFLTDGKNIRPGMSVNAWLPEQTAKTTTKGLVIPKTAVVWFMNQASVYIKNTENQFIRRILTQLIDYSANAYLVEDNVTEGELLVISGAQMLLSEQFNHAAQDDD